MDAKAVRLEDFGAYQRWRVSVGRLAGEVLCIPGLEEDAISEMAIELSYWKTPNA